MKKIIIIVLIFGGAIPNLLAQLIIKQPMDTSVCPEGVALFHISVGDQVDSIEWQVANLPSGPWIPPMGGISGVNDTILMISPPIAYDGKYFRAVVWDFLDNMDTSNIANLIVHFSPSVGIIPSDTAICEGQSVTLDGLPTNALYKWSTSETDTLSSIVVSLMDTYWVTVTDEHGCTGISSANVVVYTLPSVDITPSMPQFCQGMEVIISASPGFVTYEWKSGQISREINVDTSGVYTVVVTDSNNCVGADSVFVEENNNPKAVIKSNQDTITLVEDQSIIFRDSSEIGSGNIVLWEWDYGENAFPPNNTFHTAYNTAFVKYLKFGYKTVTLCVTDDRGCTNCDSLPQFYVKGNGPKVSITKQQGNCVTDTTKLKVTIEPSNSEDPNLVISEDIEWIYSQGEVKWDSIGELVWVNNKYLEQCLFIIFNDPNESSLISVIGFQIDTLTLDTTETLNSVLVPSGLPFPYVDEISSIIPDFICEGEFDLIEIRIAPQSESYIVYRINGGQSILDTAINGALIVPIFANLGSTVFSFEVLSIELKQGCRNSFANYSRNIPVRRRPILEFVNPDVVCVGSTDTIYATGAETYIWTSNGLETTTDSFRIIPSTVEQHILYVVTGTTAGCSAESNVSVQIVDPPSPLVNGIYTVCKGQKVIYESNSNIGNFWSVEGGTIDGSSTNPQVLVTWNSSGLINLKQEIGACDAEIIVEITVSNEESPPANDLVYLTGGGILLYPNPDLIPNLCYKWYKDGQLLPDTYQGCVVGTNLSPAELAKYAVEVYFCGQSEECAQLITFRDTKEEPIKTNFHLQAAPNPNNGVFSLEYEISDSGKYIEYIFDSSGRLIHKQSLTLETKTGNLIVSLHNANSGIYFIKWINTTTGEFRVEPFSIIQ